MITLNQRQLEKRITNNIYSESDGFIYFIILASIISVSFYFAETTEINTASLIGLVSELLLSVFGTLVAFRINKTIDNKDFIGLSFVITMKLALIIIAVFVVILMIVESNEGISIIDNIRRESLVFESLNVGFTFLFFLFLIRSFRRIRVLKFNAP